MAIKIAGEIVITDTEDLDIYGNATIGGGATIGGSATISNDLHVLDDAAIFGNMGIAGDTVMTGTLSIGSGFTVDVQAPGTTFASVIVNQMFNGAHGAFNNDLRIEGALYANSGGLTIGSDLNIQENNYMTVSLGGTTYCPQLAHHYSLKNSGGSNWCNGASGYGAPSGYSDSKGWIGLYNVVSSGNHLYHSHCLLYDINCLEAGHSPVYAHENPYWDYHGIDVATLG